MGEDEGGRGALLGVVEKSGKVSHKSGRVGGRKRSITSGIRDIRKSVPQMVESRREEEEHY